jgi:hypothetical protein
MVMFEREERTHRRDSKVYALYLYFLGLSFRSTSSKALEPFNENKRKVMFQYGIGYNNLIQR